jgi:hypothetical protein
VAEALSDGAPQLRVLDAGRGRVVISSLDLTSGLLGTNTWGIVGYDPTTCAQVMSNALLWSRTPTR